MSTEQQSNPFNYFSRRVVFTLFLVVVLSNQVTSQNKASFVAVNSGISIPVGKYAGKDLQTGSFALPGFNMNIDGAWYFLSWLGVGGQAGLNLHPVDVSALGYAKVLDDPFLEDVTIRSDPYQVVTSMVGLYARWDILPNFHLQGKLTGGMMWAKTPYQLYKPQYYLVGPDYFEITSAKSKNFMGMAGLSLQVNISPCIGLKIEGDYAYSEMTFGFKTATATRYDFRVVSFINTTLGLVIIL